MIEQTENREISVVIITHNRCEMVLEAIRSVEEQNCQPGEIIVVVDGSTDGTVAAIKQAFPDVIVIEQENHGQGIARNTGIARARGTWIALLDDDDLWHRNKLKEVTQYLQKFPECQALHHWMWYFATSEDGPREVLAIPRDFVARDLEECHEIVRESEDKPPERDSLYRPLGDLKRILHRDNASVMSSAIVRREILIRAGAFPPAYGSAGADWIMTINVARLCEWQTLPRRLGFYRFHATQISAGAPFQGAFSLVVTLSAWMTGRPFVAHSSGEKVMQELAEYGPIYRHAAQAAHWNALRKGHFAIARLARRISKVLLPRRRDYFYTLIPPQITWRWERYVLGKHK